VTADPPRADDRPADDTPGATPAPTILLERSGVVAIAKPAGLPTQAPPGIASVESWLRDRLPTGAYLGIPHRLDRAVSGVLLMARTPRAARKLSRQFERREVEKVYLAIVAPAAGAAWDDPAPREWVDRIAKIPDLPQARVVGADDGEGREAVTVARRVAELPSVTVDGSGGRLVVELRPRTGRMHQLRLQAATRGFPVVGDALYGGPGEPAPPRDAPIALHALRLRYLDPDDGGAVEVSAEVPESWPEGARGVATSG